MRRRSPLTLFCSFCGKSQHEVAKLIAGPTVHICGECVDLCHDIVHPSHEPGRRPICRTWPTRQPPRSACCSRRSTCCGPPFVRCRPRHQSRPARLWARSSALASQEPTPMSEVEDELFLMTNLYPATTGLPMVIWVGPSYGAPHDVGVKVMQHPRETRATSPSSGIQHADADRLVAATSPADLRPSQWLALNQVAILDHWNRAYGRRADGAAIADAVAADPALKCEVIRLPGGQAATVCGRGSARQAHCHVCGASS